MWKITGNIVKNATLLVTDAIRYSFVEVAILAKWILTLLQQPTPNKLKDSIKAIANAFSIAFSMVPQWIAIVFSIAFSMGLRHCHGPSLRNTQVACVVSMLDRNSC